MRVFVTGATGFIGSAIIPELISANHEVVGLARSDEAEAKLIALGAEVHRGSLEDIESLRRATEASDGVIHLGFVHDISNYAKSSETDRRAIETIGEALGGTVKPFIVTSGTMCLADTELATEESTTIYECIRTPSERLALALADKGVRVSVIRLPPLVHGEGDNGFVPRLIKFAKDSGASGYSGDGTNAWPSVHRLDAARLYRLALEKAPAGSKLHAVAEEGVLVREIAEVIGRRLGMEVVSKPTEHFGFVGLIIARNNRTSSAITKLLLDWVPTERGILADIEAHYFTE